MRGRDLVSGLPTTIKLTSDEIYRALKEPVATLVSCVRSVLEKTPPELSSDIIDRGIVLTGGGALLDGMPELLQAETGIATIVADRPLECVAVGTGKVLSSLQKLKDSVVMTHNKK